MLLHVITIPFIAPHSTHAAPQLPQSRNMSSHSANCTPQLSLTNIDQFCAAINTPYNRHLAINQGN